jgi:FkbM family methyltransferase
MRTFSFDVGYILSIFDLDSFDASLDLVFRNDRTWLDMDNKSDPYPTFLKLCILQRYFDLDDEDLYISIADRKSFLKFLNVRGMDDLPEISRLAYFKRRVTESNVIYAFFAELDKALAKEGIVVRRGKARDPRIIRISEGDNRHEIAKPKEDFITEIYYSGIPFPMKFRSNTSDLRVFREIMIEKGYDLQLTIEPKFILDCGANIGLSSVFFKNMFRDSFIVAVEPEASNFALAEHNLSYYYPSVECLRAAIWHKNSRVAIKNKDAGKWSFMVEECDANEEDGIDTVTIGQIMRKYQQESIDILKIDIEGAELELFAGNYEEWLPNSKVIMVETHDHMKKGCSKSLFAALSQYNFSVSLKGNLLFCIQE